MTNDGATVVEIRDRFAELDCFINVQQMMGVFVKTNHAFGCESSSQRKNQIVVRKNALDITMRNRYRSFVRIDARNFRLDEVDAPVKHGMPQIEGNVLGPALIKCEPHQSRIKHKTTASRNERNLVILAQLLGKTFSGRNATKPATKDQDLRHRRYPSRPQCTTRTNSALWL